jgi:hypothetical protein
MLRILLEFLLTLSNGHAETCISTSFAHEGDKHAGGPSPFLGRRVRPDDHGIAHRFAPGLSWTVVYSPRTKLATAAPVIDRGPYGANLRPHEVAPPGSKVVTRKDGRRWYVKKRGRWPGKWRGCADLTPPVAAAIQHRGFERVRIYHFFWKPKKHRREKRRRYAAPKTRLAHRPSS